MLAVHDDHRAFTDMLYFNAQMKAFHAPLGVGVDMSKLTLKYVQAAEEKHDVVIKQLVRHGPYANKYLRVSLMDAYDQQ